MKTLLFAQRLRIIGAIMLFGLLATIGLPAIARVLWYPLIKTIVLTLLVFVSCNALAATPLALTVKGADEALKTNIALTLGAVYAGDLDSYFFPRRLRKAVIASANALGYYHSEYDYAVAERQITLTVVPGPKVVWTAADIQISGEAAAQPEVKKVLAQSPFVPGKTINHGVYDEYKQQLIDTLLQLGYQNAAFERSELRVNTRDNVATAILGIHSGPRYKIAAIEYQGGMLNRPLLDSLAVIRVGDWYSRALVAQQYKSLLDTGFFDTVEVKPQFDHGQGQVTVQVNLQQVASNRYLLGGGFGTDTGPRLTLRWIKPVVNASGHSFYSELEVSENLQEMTARYQVPVGHPLNRFLEWGSGVQNKHIEDTDSLRITTGLNLHTSSNQWQRVLGVNIESEKYQQGSEPAQQTTYVLPTASWSYTALSPSADQGYRFWINAQTSTQDLYSDTSFFRAVSGIKYLAPLAANHSLLTRLELGVLLNSNFDEVPASKRFFTGGDQTVRGYNFESLAPRNSDGELIGGDRLNVASLEYRWRFKPQWAVAAFVDTGRAYFEADQPFRTGAGIGARWYSPIGQVSVDVAFPVNDREYDGYQLHIYMGPPL